MDFLICFCYILYRLCFRHGQVKVNKKVSPLFLKGRDPPSPRLWRDRGKRITKPTFGFFSREKKFSRFPRIISPYREQSQKQKTVSDFFQYGFSFAGIPCSVSGAVFRIPQQKITSSCDAGASAASCACVSQSSCDVFSSNYPFFHLMC